MQSDDKQGSVITLDELAQVTGGGGAPEEFEGPNFYEQDPPVVTPNDRFLLGVESDYPKRPFEQPR
jgi:hypothetical protein